MRIIFVRHGEPDYLHDCLTQNGHKQAASAAERLYKEGITEIYSSPCGRAFETASYTAMRLDLPVVKLDYMREISWGGFRIPSGGHPWTLSDRMLEDGFDFYSNDWQDHPYFNGNVATEYYKEITKRFDDFLAGHGYKHEGRRLMCVEGTDKTIALFSHGGSGACVLAHLLGLPFPYVASVMPYDFTSITILELPAESGKYVHARLELFNDCAHIQRTSARPVLQEKVDER